MVGFEPRRTLNVFVLSILSLGVVISLRNLPLTAEYGLSSIFFYVAAALFFMIPYALMSAEMASGWPKAGGVYIWVREALGERWGFFAIWLQWFHNVTWYPAMLAFIATALAYVFNPALATNKTYLLTVILCGFWGVTFLNFLGIKTSAFVSTFFVIIGTIIPGAILTLLAAFWVWQGMPLQFELGWSNLIPDLSPSNLVFLAGIFLALSGLEANANLAREVKNPQKNYPKAIFIAAILTLAILIFGSLAIASVVPKSDIGLLSGLLDAFRAFFEAFHLAWMIPVIAIFTAIGAIGELNAWAIAAAKGMFVTSEHGALPPYFHKVNSRHVPTRLLVTQAIVVTIASLVFLYMPNVNISYWVLSAISAQMYIIMYILLLISGIRLRYKYPRVHRTYKIPFGNAGIWIAGILGLSSSLFVLFFSFFPPKEFETGNLTVYETTLTVAIAVSCLIPLVIHALRKPEWQKKVLVEIREEIHRSTTPGG
jgi:putative glutamate/gamma-aminobutyrate antiporter